VTVCPICFGAGCRTCWNERAAAAAKARRSSAGVTRYLTTAKPERWQRSDGSFDVLAYCRWLDDNANTGAGPRREEEA